MENDDFQARFWDHLEDLRRTLLQIVCIILSGMVICFLFQEYLIDLLTYPLRVVQPDAKLVLLSPIEGFMTAIKVSFWTGLTVTFPFWAFPLIKFVIPGLQEGEKGLLLPFLFGSIVCVGLGGGVAYFVTLPIANSYFYQYNSLIGINLWSLNSYLEFSLLLIFGHAVVFESGLLLVFLVYWGYINAQTMRTNRRIFYVCAFIVGALITPPDVLSQLMVAIPLIMMYELCLLYAKLKKNRVKSTV